MVGDVDFRKSLSGYLLTFAGGVVLWQSILQPCVALSTKEAEYIAIIEGCKETLWMKNFLQELGVKQDSSVVYCKEFGIWLEIQAYWCEVLLGMRRAWEETVTAWEDSHNREWIRYDDKDIAQREVEKLNAKSGLGGAPKWSRGGDLLGPSYLGGPSPNCISLGSYVINRNMKEDEWNMVSKSK